MYSKLRFIKVQFSKVLYKYNACKVKFIYKTIHAQYNACTLYIVQYNTCSCPVQYMYMYCTVQNR